MSLADGSEKSDVIDSPVFSALTRLSRLERRRWSVLPADSRSASPDRYRPGCALGDLVAAVRPVLVLRPSRPRSSDWRA